MSGFLASIRSHLQPGLLAIREQARTFLLIQAFILGVVIAYYQLPGFARFAGELADIKVRGGLLLSFVATMFAGMFLPEIFKRIAREGDRPALHDLAYTGLVFGISGVLVDLFYRFQAWMFGHEATFWVVAKKVAVDQIFAAPLLFCPYFVLAYLWRDSRFSSQGVRERLAAQSLFDRLASTTLVNWIFWIPALCGVYAMPSNLQFVLFLFVEAAWSLIVVHMTRSRKPDHFPNETRG